MGKTDSSFITETLNNKWTPQFWDDVVKSVDPTSTIKEHASAMNQLMQEEEGLRMLLEPYGIDCNQPKLVKEGSLWIKEFIQVSLLFADAWESLPEPKALNPNGPFAENLRAANERLISKEARYYNHELKKAFETARKDTELEKQEFIRIETNEFQSIFDTSNNFEAAYVSNRLAPTVVDIQLLRKMRVHFVQGTITQHLYTIDTASMVMLGMLTAIKEYIEFLKSEAAIGETQVKSTQENSNLRLPIKPDRRTEKQMKDAIDDAFRSLKKNGYLNSSTTIESFRSIFMPSATLIKGTQWDSNYKTLRYFIYRLVGKDFKVKIHKAEYKKGEPKYKTVKTFKHESAFSSEVKPNLYLSRRVENCFLDDEGKAANPKTFVNDNNPGELDSKTMEQLNTASNYLRGE